MGDLPGTSEIFFSNTRKQANSRGPKDACQQSQGSAEAGFGNTNTHFHHIARIKPKHNQTHTHQQKQQKSGPGHKQTNPQATRQTAKPGRSLDQLCPTVEEVGVWGCGKGREVEWVRVENKVDDEDELGRGKMVDYEGWGTGGNF